MDCKMGGATRGDAGGAVDLREVDGMEGEKGGQRCLKLKLIGYATA